MGKKPWDDLREERYLRWFIACAISCLVSVTIIPIAGSVLISPLKEIALLLALGLHLYVVWGPFYPGRR